MAKKKSELSFDFGANVKPKKGKAQTKATKQAFAVAKRKGGELHGRSGS